MQGLLHHPDLSEMNRVNAVIDPRIPHEMAASRQEAYRFTTVEDIMRAVSTHSHNTQHTHNTAAPMWHVRGRFDGQQPNRLSTYPVCCNGHCGACVVHVSACICGGVSGASAQIPMDALAQNDRHDNDM